MNAAVARPFPWKSLEAIPPGGVASLRDARRWAAQHVRLEAFARALESLIGAKVRILVKTAAPRAVGAAIAGGIGVILASGEGPGEGGADRREGLDLPRGALLEVETALAAAVVSRAIRRPVPSVTERSAPPSGPLAGGFAAVVAAAARRAYAGRALRIGTAGGAEILEAGFTRGEGEVLSLSLTVLVGDEAYSARLLIARDEAVVAPPPGWNRRVLASLDAMPIAVPIVACATVATLAELAGLHVGDAWLPGAWALDVVKDGAGGSLLRGPVLLAAPMATTGVRATLVENGRLVLSGEVDAVGSAGGGEIVRDDVGAAGRGRVPVEGGEMSEDREDALLTTVGDVPVVVRVEIGEARMPAREWASLGRGDVITLGRRLGELVVLRVGGIPIARGELVSVDGEVGVRITERIGDDPTLAEERATET